MVFNNGIAPCGTMARCCCCNMRLICAKSPYCVIGGSSDKDLEEIKTLLTTLTANVATVQETSNIIMTELGEFRQDTQTKLDEIYTKVENINTASGQSMPVEVVEDDSKSLAVLNPKEEETILVEKKGLFGKSKWVEQKKS